MTDWGKFPSFPLPASTPLYRIHQAVNGPAYFTNAGGWRFDPPPTERANYGVCYLGTEDLGPYVEVFGRIRHVPQTEIDGRRLTEMNATRDLELADLTERTALGDYDVTGDISMGTDYTPAQELGARLFHAGFDGILYRLRHDPQMTLEGVALFGDPGEQPTRFTTPKTGPIPSTLIAAGHAFGITVLPSAPLP